MDAMGQGLTGTEEERAAQRLIDKACTILPGIAGDVPQNFAVQLFARVAPEDLVRCEPRELAELAAGAWAFLQKREPGMPKIRILSPSASAGASPRLTSILDILTHHIPFLSPPTMPQSPT